MTRGDLKTYVVERPEQRQALSSPIRLELLGHFMTPGGMSIGEIAERMGRPASTLYYHFRRLEHVGLIKRAGTRPRGKRLEALFEPVAQRIAMSTECGSEPALRAALKTVAAAFRMAERDLEAALRSGDCRPLGAHRNTFATRMHCRLTKATLAEINGHLGAIERIVSREARRRKLRPDADQYCSLTLALLPLRGRG
jgi:AcrR family transcriptional regulator